MTVWNLSMLFPFLRSRGELPCAVGQLGDFGSARRDGPSRTLRLSSEARALPLASTGGRCLSWDDVRWSRHATRIDMAMDDRGGIGSKVVRFPCGHENPFGHRFCDVCGAWNGLCPRCESANREDAKFCRACGVRLEGKVGGVQVSPPPERERRRRDIVVETLPRESPRASDPSRRSDRAEPTLAAANRDPAPLRRGVSAPPVSGSNRKTDVPGLRSDANSETTRRWPGPGTPPPRSRADDEKGSDPAWPRLRAGETYAPPVASAFVDDFHDGEQKARRGRSLPLVGIIVVTLAIVVGVALLWPGRQCGLPGLSCDRNTRTAKAERPDGGANADPKSRVPSGPQNAPATAEVGTPSLPSTPSFGASASSSERAATSPVATAPPGGAAPSEREGSSSPPADAPAAQASPSEGPQLPPRTLLRSREDQGTERAGARTARAEAARPSPANVTSEERMATFLLHSLDPGDAEARARANSTWYEPGQMERADWERVA